MAGETIPIAAGKAAAMQSYLAQGGERVMRGNRRKSGPRYTEGPNRGRTTGQAIANFENLWETAPPRVKDKYAKREQAGIALAPSEMDDDQPGQTHVRQGPVPGKTKTTPKVVAPIAPTDGRTRSAAPTDGSSPAPVVGGSTSTFKQRSADPSVNTGADPKPDAETNPAKGTDPRPTAQAKQQTNEEISAEGRGRALAGVDFEKGSLASNSRDNDIRAAKAASRQKSTAPDGNVPHGDITDKVASRQKSTAPDGNVPHGDVADKVASRQKSTAPDDPTAPAKTQETAKPPANDIRASEADRSQDPAEPDQDPDTLERVKKPFVPFPMKNLGLSEADQKRVDLHTKPGVVKGTLDELASALDPAPIEVGGMTKKPTAAPAIGKDGKPFVPRDINKIQFTPEDQALIEKHAGPGVYGSLLEGINQTVQKGVDIYEGLTDPDGAGAKAAAVAARTKATAATATAATATAAAATATAAAATGKSDAPDSEADFEAGPGKEWTGIKHGKRTYTDADELYGKARTLDALKTDAKTAGNTPQSMDERRAGYEARMQAAPKPYDRYSGPTAQSAVSPVPRAKVVPEEPSIEQKAALKTSVTGSQEPNPPGLVASGPLKTLDELNAGNAQRAADTADGISARRPAKPGDPDVKVIGQRAATLEELKTRRVALAR